VHGDLSAYNVLYWNDKLKIIDLPQAVNPYVNPEAFKLLARDLERLCDYFARYGVHANAPQLARDLWERHILRQNKIRPEAIAR
jgi:RIO kinase 1